MLQISGSFFDAKERVWHGRNSDHRFHKDASLGDIALSTLDINPNKVIQVCDTTGETLTCQQMATLSKRVAHYFRHKIGLQQEDVVGIMASNTTFVAPIMFGAFLSGTPISPAYHRMDRQELKLIFGLTKPKIVFCDADCYDELVNGLKEIDLQCKILIIKGHISGVKSVHEILQESGFDDNFSPVVLKEGGEQTAVILCTSGTTGIPKPVCLSHETILNKSSYSFVTSNDVAFTFSSVYWISGINILVMSGITGALRVITDRPFSPEYFLELIEKYKITQLITTSPVVSRLVQCPDIARRDLSSVKLIASAGSPLSESVAEKLSKHLRKHSLCESYGITEIGGGVSWNRFLKEKNSSVGQLVPNIRAKIIAENGKRMQIGELGEIHLQTKYKWRGYYKNPELTRSVLDGEGWLKTGDLGYFDEEGFLFVCGRQQDMLKYRNMLISPRDIEEVIQKVPGVIEVCVFGMREQVEHDLITAAVVKSKNVKVTEKDICRSVADCLPEASHLRGGVFFMQEFPRTPSGKVQKHKLQAILV